MTVHKVAEAFPSGGSSTATTIQQKLAAGFPLVIETGDDATDLNFDAAGTAVAMVPEVIIVRDTKTVFGREEGNNDAHNGTTVLVTACGKHYTTGLSAQNFTNALTRTDTPPDTPAAGDRVIVGDAPTGDYAGQGKKLTYYNGGQWVFVSPVIGQRVYVRDEEVDYQYTESGTWEQAGEIAADSVGASELAFPWGMVVEEETATPPGTRATGATPTMPLGGTAANINDNSTATEATTSALGNLSAASADGRVIAKLDLGADTALAAIEVVGIKASTGSSSASAMKLAYATAAAPTTWVDLGAGFTLSTSDQTVARSGTFTARYVAVITEAKDWSTATHTLDDLNAYKQATSLADGTKVLVAANGIGVFSGHDTEVAEAWDGAYRFYDAYDGAEVFDQAAGVSKRFDGDLGEWASAAGAVLDFAFVKTVSGSHAQSGSSVYTYSDTVAPTLSAVGQTDGGTLTHEAVSASPDLLLTYQARMSNVLTGDGTRVRTVALFRDTETTAIDWMQVYPADSLYFLHIQFLVEGIDASSHEYKIRFFNSATNQGSLSLFRRLFTAMEVRG